MFCLYVCAEIKAAFAVFDKNNDGMITNEELAVVVIDRFDCIACVLSVCLCRDQGGVCSV